MLTDQIADMFTRIRNAIGAHKRTVTVPASKIKKEITRILYENHFISKYAFVDEGRNKQIKIMLKYDKQMRNAIQGIQRISRPGRKHYSSVDDMPRVLKGMGVVIVSTSKGVMTDRDCRKHRTGGELIGKVW